MPISCHFRDCKALLVTSSRVSSAIASTRPLSFSTAPPQPIYFTYVPVSPHFWHQISSNQFTLPVQQRQNDKCALRSACRLECCLSAKLHGLGGMRRSDTREQRRNRHSLKKSRKAESTYTHTSPYEAINSTVYRRNYPWMLSLLVIAVNTASHTVPVGLM